MSVSHDEPAEPGPTPTNRDPFDRLLIAQAQCERLPLLTADSQFARYGVEAVWAGHREALGMRWPSGGRLG